MNKKAAYSYTVLRYVHDIVTGEFVNIGVILYAPAAQRIYFKIRGTIGRLKGIFPDIDRSAFITSVQSTRRALQKVSKTEHSSDLFDETQDALKIARKVIPTDDSSLQWSSISVGVSEDPRAALDRLYERLVSRYDSHSRHRRTDDDVWRPVRQKLEDLSLADRLQEKAIVGGLDDIHFKHAWKNGQWHVYEPLSFDLVDAEGIKGKAREWLGHLSAVLAGGRAEEFKAHFVVGKPSNPTLDSAYRSAITILRAAPNSPEIYEEAEVDALVAKIEDEVRSHDAGLS